MREDIMHALRAGGGVIRLHDHPALAQRLRRLRRQGELEAILPGILMTPAVRGDWRVRVRAGLLWLGPDAVLTGHGAARLSFWPDCSDDDLVFMAPHPPRQRAGYRVTRGQVPPEWIQHRDGVPISDPAYTAVDLAGDVGGADAIDRALRQGVSLARMWDALGAMPHRAGNRCRRMLLQDSRDEPWSELEREGHRLLRQHRLTGWQTNARVAVDGHDYYLDVLFRRLRLVIEFDGYAYHTDPEAFENDRRRRNELILAGYTVLNFTWSQVFTDPDWVMRCVKRAINMATDSLASAGFAARRTQSVVIMIADEVDGDGMPTSWSGVAEAYRRSFAGVCAGTFPVLLESAQGRGARLLDVGSGTGIFARHAADAGYAVTAVDADPEMVAMTAAELGDHGKTLQAELPDIPVTAGQFDIVAANFVINHVPKPAAAVGELARLVRPGGAVLITTWTNQPTAQAQLFSTALDAAGAVRPESFRLPAADDFERSPDGLAELAVAAGLTVEESRELHWDWKIGPDDLWAGVEGGVATIGRTYQAQTPDIQQQIRAAFYREAQALMVGGDIVLPTVAAFVLATKPGGRPAQGS